MPNRPGPRSMDDQQLHAATEKRAERIRAAWSAARRVSQTEDTHPQRSSWLGTWIALATAAVVLFLLKQLFP